MNPKYRDPSSHPASCIQEARGARHPKHPWWGGNQLLSLILKALGLQHERMEARRKYVPDTEGIGCTHH